MRTIFRAVVLGFAVVTTAATGWAQTRIYTPRPGSSERTAIMDAARIATNTTEQFIVRDLTVLDGPLDAVAFADIEIASRSVEIGGVFLFRRIEGRWRAVAMVGGGGGSSDCTSVAPIVDLFVLEARRFAAPPTMLPPALYRVQAETKSGTQSCSVGEMFVDGRPAAAQSESAAATVFHYVEDTRPPDAWLSLRSAPGGGYELVKLYNGTLLQVLERRSDNWWRVRASETGATGWVLSRSGSRVWVHCCKSATP